MTDQPRSKDRRAVTSAGNGRRSSGRPKVAENTRIYKLLVSADLHAWMRDRGPEEVRQALERWRIETLIV